MTENIPATVDIQWLIQMVLAFCRCSAMVMVSPLFGAAIAPKVRILFSFLVALTLGQTVMPNIVPPTEVYGLGVLIAQEIMAGLLIGMCIQALLLAAQAAGSFLDLQLGLNSAQLFNPMLGMSTSLMGQVKFMLSLVLLLMLDGHHMMLTAYVSSYQIAPTFQMGSLEKLVMAWTAFLGQTLILSMQIAAPAAGVALIIDACAGLVNKSIPQMQVYFVTSGAKTMMGLMTVALGLPLMAMVVRQGVDNTALKISELLLIGR